MKTYVPAVGTILVFILLAHLAAPGEYRWTQHTISQLAAQGYGQAWIMRAGFIVVGRLVLAAGAGRMRATRAGWFRELPIMLYGLAILLAGVFSADPFIAGEPFSEVEARLHSIFATLAGVSISAAVLLYVLTESPPTRRWMHIVALILLTLISGLFGSLPAIGGALQRALWLAGFSWLALLGSDLRGAAWPGEDVASA